MFPLTKILLPLSSSIMVQYVLKQLFEVACFLDRWLYHTHTLDKKQKSKKPWSLQESMLWKLQNTLLQLFTEVYNSRQTRLFISAPLVCVLIQRAVMKILVLKISGQQTKIFMVHRTNCSKILVWLQKSWPFLLTFWNGLVYGTSCMPLALQSGSLYS